MLAVVFGVRETNVSVGIPGLEAPRDSWSTNQGDVPESGLRQSANVARAMHVLVPWSFTVHPGSTYGRALISTRIHVARDPFGSRVLARLSVSAGPLI